MKYVILPRIEMMQLHRCNLTLHWCNPIANCIKSWYEVCRAGQVEVKPSSLHNFVAKKTLLHLLVLQKWVSSNHGLELQRKQNLESKLCFSMNWEFHVLTCKNKRKVFTVKVVVWQKFNAQSWHRPSCICPYIMTLSQMFSHATLPLTQ